MRFEATPIPGLWVIEPEPVVDDRGYFARTFDRPRFGERQLSTSFELCALSLNRERGTMRGLHFQRDPHGEEKLVRCARGRIFDVVADLRPESPTFLRWYGTELDERTLRQLYVPRGCAHGFLTLEPDTVVHYAIDAPHVSTSADGVRWDDPALGIEWPEAPSVISERDAAYADVARRLPPDATMEADQAHETRQC